MSRIFLVEADTKSDAFRNWFRNSHVVDDQGQPAVVYHGTTSAGNFEVFRQFNDIGHHFGTSQAANDRIASRNRDVRYKDEPGRVYPVYLSIQRPLELPDLGTWEPDGLAKMLYEKGIFSEKEYQNIAMRSDRQSRTEAFRQALKRAGYDGIRYENTAEEAGSTSWIALDPGQIKSIFNRGTWDKRRASIME